MTPTDAPRPAPPEPRGCLPTLVAFLLMVGILGAGAVAENAVADAPTRPIELTEGVTVTPPDGWDFGGRSEDGGAILLSRGTGSLVVSVREGTDVVAALTGMRNEWLATGKVTASEIEATGSDRSGATAHRFTYSGTFPDQAAPVEGEVTGFAGTSVTVIFDGWAGFGDYASVRDEIAEIIRGAVVP